MSCLGTETGGRLARRGYRDGVVHHRDAGRFEFAFNDIFTFRDGLIAAAVDSYVVPIT